MGEDEKLLPFTHEDKNPDEVFAALHRSLRTSLQIQEVVQKPGEVVGRHMVSAQKLHLLPPFPSNALLTCELQHQIFHSSTSATVPHTFIRVPLMKFIYESLHKVYVPFLNWAALLKTLSILALLCILWSTVPPISPWHRLGEHMGCTGRNQEIPLHLHHKVIKTNLVD